MAYKGFFKPRNPQKYAGDPTKIVYRSRWELTLMGYLDKHPDVIAWGSEEISVAYWDPVTEKRRRYFPDFVVKRKTKDGTIETVVIEVKPAAQCVAPEVQKKRTKAYVRAVCMWGTNSAKWKAARALCEEKGWKFQLMTEHDIYGKAV